MENGLSHLPCNTTPTSSTAILFKLGLLFLARILCHQDAPKTSRLKPLHLLSCNLFKQGAPQNTRRPAPLPPRHIVATWTCLRRTICLGTNPNMPNRRPSIPSSYPQRGCRQKHERPGKMRRPTTEHNTYVQSVTFCLKSLWSRAITPAAESSLNRRHRLKEVSVVKVQRLTHVFSHLSLAVTNTLRPSRAAIPVRLGPRESIVSLPNTQRNTIHGATPRRQSKNEDLHAWARHHPCKNPLIVAQGIRSSPLVMVPVSGDP